MPSKRQKDKVRVALDIDSIGLMLDQIKRLDAVREADSVGEVFSASPLFGAAAIPVGHDAPARQSGNIEDRRNEAIAPTYDDLDHAIPGALSNWDFPRAKRLADTTPMAGQEMDFPIVEASRLSQVNLPKDDDLPEWMLPPDDQGAGLANPGTLLQSQAVNRHIQDSVQPSRLTDQGPIDSSLFQMGPTGNWGPSYPTATEQRSSRWRPGLRYAPWNMR
jgi:hypothetical protein